MPPKQSPAFKPAFVPLPKPLPQKKEDVKTSDKSKDKSKEKPRVKVYEAGHRRVNSYDTGYASGYSSPRVEERSPLDYTTTAPKSPKPQPDKEAYEIITGSSKPRYVKPSTERKTDVEQTAERKKGVRYVSRNPDSPGTEDEYVLGPSAESRKDRFAGPKKSTLILQEKLADKSETRPTPKKVSFDDTRNQELEAEIRQIRLQRQMAEGRAAEAKLKQQRIDELDRREQELKRQQTEEQSLRWETMSPREAELAEQQWKEIQATPVINPPQRRPATVAEPKPVSRRHPLMTPYGSTALTTATTSPNVLATENPFLAPILEAQADEDARRAREERRRSTAIKETSRTQRQRPRNDDRYI